MSLSPKQHGVLKGIIAGASITLIVIAAAIVSNPIALPEDTSIGNRIGFSLQLDLVLALWLALSIGRLARHRFFTPEDIDGGGLTQGTQAANVLQAGLQNTLEQTVLAVLVHAIWAAVMPASWISAIPFAVVLFLCGRIMFVRGYSGGAPSRALGFALTFYPSVLMLLLIVIRALSQTFFPQAVL